MKKFGARGKKLFSFALLALTAVMSVAVFAACTPIEDDCEHEWAEATCNMARVCMLCGKTSGEALGHEFGEWTVVEPVTCEKDGSRSAECSRCGQTVTFILDKQAHTYKESGWTQTKAPTCSEEGERENHCTVCGEVKTESVEKIAHTPGKWNVAQAATCTAVGSECTECTECGANLTRELKMLDHSFEAEAVEEKYLCAAATCTAKATYYKSCSSCGLKGTQTFETGELANHTESTWIIDVAAECEKSGSKHTECTVCGESLQTNVVIDALVHEFTKESAIADYLCSDANCTDKATYYKSCALCGKKGTETFEYGEANGHAWEDVIDVAAKCEEVGSMHRVCKTCDAETQPSEIKALGHNCKTKEVITASVETGRYYYVQYKCTNEGCEHFEIEEKSKKYMGDNASFGLEYRSGTVIGIGTCTDTVLVIPDYNENGVKVTSVDKEAFINNTNITSVTFGQYVTTVGAKAFANNASLKSVTFGAAVNTVGESAFSCCTALETIVFSADAKNVKIQTAAFIGCASLKNATFNGIKELGDYAFFGCAQLVYDETSLESAKKGFHSLP